MGRVYTQYRQAHMINSILVLHNSGWLICDLCRYFVQTLARELRRKILNSIANQVTVWIRRSNVICVFLCTFVKCINLVNNVAIHFGLYPTLLPMYPFVISNANFYIKNSYIHLFSWMLSPNRYPFISKPVIVL